MKGYKKEDVQLHTEGYYGTAYPAVNVKSYSFPSIYKVMEALGTEDEKATEKACELAWDCACENFWQFDGAERIVQHYWGKGTKFYSAGRSSGWLIVVNIGLVEDWDGVQLNKWALFERAIKAEVRWLTSLEFIVEEIKCNEWLETCKSVEEPV